MESDCRLAARHPGFAQGHVVAYDKPRGPPPFCSYSAWLAERGEASDGPLVPHLAAGVRQLARIGDGCQVSALLMCRVWILMGSVASSAAAALRRHTSVRPRPGVRRRRLCGSKAYTASMETASCGRIARAKKALGGGDPPPACFSGASSAPGDQAARHRLYRSADGSHFMGRHWFPLWAGLRPASGGICTPVWHFPPTASQEDWHGRRAGRMAGAQPEHLEPAEGKERRCILAATVHGGRR